MATVSIGIPVYNGEKYLALTLDSLLAQKFQDFEVVISDNASTDRTGEICLAYRAKDRRIRYCRNVRNIGAAPNFNRVVQLARAPLFHGGAHDDLYHPEFLGRCVAALDREPGAVLSHTRTMLIGDAGEPLRYDSERNCYIDSYGGTEGTSGDVMRPQPFRIAEQASPALRFRDVIWHMGWSLPLSGVIRSDALRRTALYHSYSGADKVLLAELALQGRFHEIGDELFAKRMHRDCTHYKSTRERAAYESSEPTGVPQLRMIRDYAKMALAARMTTRERLHCMVTIAGKACHFQAWRRFVVPGPDNFLGWSFADK